MKNIAIAAAITTAFAALSTPVWAANDNVQDYARGRILVEPRAGLTTDEFSKLLKTHGGKPRKLGQSNLHIVDLPATASEKAVIAQLRKNPNLKYAELDQRVPVSLSVNDPFLGSEWHIGKIGADVAWDKTLGAGVTIAILDSGIDASHPDLAARMVAGYNIFDNNTNTADVCGHGTKVAGAAAAAANNGAGVAGVAGQAKIMPVRIAYLDPTYGCYAYFSTIASGITWAADHGARVVNVSYASLPSSAAVISAANYLKGKGGLMFASAGNYNRDEGFTPTSAMISVSATDSADNRAGFSSYGNFVSLSAPGAGIYTTVQGGGYGAVNGTSFASPVAAGVAALMMAANPALGSAGIEGLLYSTAADLGTTGRDPYFGYGRVNAAAAVQAAAASVPPVDTSAPQVAITSPSASSTVSGLVVVNANASDNVGVARVELVVNNTVVASDSTGPFGFSWDSSAVANGMAALVAVAYDDAGNIASSAPVLVNVANNTAPPVADTVAPALLITNPGNGSTVSGNVAIVLNASDNGGAAGISMTLYIDGALKASGTGSSMTYNWNTKKMASGMHTIQASARDKAGNVITTQVQVNSR